MLERSRWLKRSTHLWIQESLLTSNAPLPLFHLEAKVAVITGGNGGIGLGCARGLARAGATIVIWARDVTKNAAAKAELEALGAQVITLEVDVTDRTAVEAATQETIKRCGGIDILFANAGVNIRMRPEEYTEDIVDQIIDVNLKAVFHCCQSVYPSMKSRGGGKIILIGSLTSVQGLGVAPVYSATKGAVVQLGKSLAGAWGADNIQVNTILPGWIVTEMTSVTRAVPGLPEHVLSRTPAGRWGSPADFEGIATFFASGASDFVTGTDIQIDGGFTSTLAIFDLPKN
jgi:2-dehydro-3-deoxy-D-gluconate 5-dehydrogenase